MEAVLCVPKFTFLLLQAMRASFACFWHMVRSRTAFMASRRLMLHVVHRRMMSKPFFSAHRVTGVLHRPFETHAWLRCIRVAQLAPLTGKRRDFPLERWNLVAQVQYSRC
jgi:hypothetical protein